MLRADLVRRRDAFYDADFVHADLLACYEVLQESSFGFVPEILTFTRRHSGAVTRTVAKLMTHRAEGVRIFLRYGRTHLDEREYERRLAVLVADYLWELCRNPRHLLDHEVRAYDAGVMRGILASDTPSGLLRGVVLQLRRMLSGGRRANGVDWLADRYGGAQGTHVRAARDR